MQETLEFEDLFEIVMPSGIDRRIFDLDAAWQQLKIDSKNDPYVLNEVKNWESWSSKVLESFFSKIFATGVLNELDKWKERYSVAYNKVSSSDKLAPIPTVFADKNSILSSPVFWVVMGLLLTTGVFLYAKRK